MNEKAFDPAPPKKPEEIGKGPSGFVGAQLLGMTIEQIFDPAPPATEWSGAKKVDFAGMDDGGHGFMMML